MTNIAPVLHLISFARLFISIVHFLDYSNIKHQTNWLCFFRSYHIKWKQNIWCLLFIESYWEWAHCQSISTQNPNQFLLVCSWEWPRGNLLGNNISLVWIMICWFRQHTFSLFAHRQQFHHYQIVLHSLIIGIICLLLCLQNSFLCNASGSTKGHLER